MAMRAACRHGQGIQRYDSDTKAGTTWSAAVRQSRNGSMAASGCRAMPMQVVFGKEATEPAAEHCNCSPTECSLPAEQLAARRLIQSSNCRITYLAGQLCRECTSVERQVVTCIAVGPCHQTQSLACPAVCTTCRGPAAALAQCCRVVGSPPSQAKSLGAGSQQMQLNDRGRCSIKPLQASQAAFGAALEPDVGLSHLVCTSDHKLLHSQLRAPSGGASS